MPINPAKLIVYKSNERTLKGYENKKSFLPVYSIFVNNSKIIIKNECSTRGSTKCTKENPGKAI